jgi:hypothetical protein
VAEIAGLIFMLWLLSVAHGFLGDSAASGSGAGGIFFRLTYVLSGLLLVLMALATLTASYLVILRHGFGHRTPAAAPTQAPLASDEDLEDDEAWHPGERLDP